MAIAAAPRAGRQIELQVGIVEIGRRDGGDSLFAQQRTAQIGVYHDARCIEHAPKVRSANLANRAHKPRQQGRKRELSGIGHLSASNLLAYR